MMMERTRADRFWRRVRFIESKLRQIRRFRYYDRMRFRRLETFAARRLVDEALADYEATRAANALEAENQSQNSSDGNNGNGGNGNGMEMAKMKIQMRIIGMLGLLLESVPTKTSLSVNHSTSRERKEYSS
ncbi:hypothetical protein Tco_1432181 [Tanacetum coccineum]